MITFRVLRCKNVKYELFKKKKNNNWGFWNVALQKNVKYTRKLDR